MNIDMKKGRETQREKKRGDAGRRGGGGLSFKGDRK